MARETCWQCLAFCWAVTTNINCENEISFERQVSKWNFLCFPLLLPLVRPGELYRKWYLEDSFIRFLFRYPLLFLHSLTRVKEAINFHIHPSSAFITFITNDCTLWTWWCLCPYSLMFYYFCFVLPICFRGEFPSFLFLSCFCLLFLCVPINNEGNACASPPYGTMWFSLAVAFCEK